MKRITLWCLLCFFAIRVGYGQEKPAWVADRPVLREYYIGIAQTDKATKDYIENAKQKALSDLVASIEAKVTREASTRTREDSTGNYQVYKESIKVLVKANVQGAEYVDSWEDKKFYYVYYRLNKQLYEGTRKRELEKLHQKVVDYVSEGKKYENLYQVTDALRQYYWAKAALAAHDINDEIKLTEEDGNEKNAWSWLDARIRSVFGNIQVICEEVEQEEGKQLVNVSLSVFYKNHPAAGCFDFYYFDGDGYMSASGKDGQAMMVCWYKPERKFKILCEYQFLNQAKLEDQDMFQALRALRGGGYAEEDKALQEGIAWITVSGKSKNSFRKATQQNLVAVNASNKIKVAKGNEVNAMFERLAPDNEAIYRNTMETIERAVRNNRYDSIRPYFTDDGYEMFCGLVKYGHALLFKFPEYRFLQAHDHVICQSLPLLFRFEGSQKEFVNDIVFRLNADGKVSSLAFALSQQTQLDIMGMKDWCERSRLELLEFVENYQTAYALKRIDYLDNVFSENALIIVGYQLKKQNIAAEIPLSKDRVVTVKKSKQDYIKDLRASFNRNKYIHLQFSDCSVMRSGSGREIYGIQVKQEYVSSTYADVGYLFLKVDITNADRPQIYIRTWQQEKDPNLYGGVYSLVDFDE